MEYEILQDAPVLTGDQIDKLPRASAESRMSVLSEEEVDVFHSTPSFDPTKRAPNTFRMMGKSLIDLIATQALDNPVTHMEAIGRDLDEGPLPSLQKEIDKKRGSPAARDWLVTKLKATRAALNDKFDMSPEETTPRNFFEALAVMGTQAIGTMGETMAITAAGGNIAGGLGAGAAGIKKVKLTLAALTSFSIEKPIVERQLLDAGFEGGFADRMSTYYGILVAPLDAVSFGFLTGAMKMSANKAVSSVVGKVMSNGVGRYVARGLGEGVTEAVQGQIQTEFEVGLKLQNRDFQNTLASRSLEFIVGTLIGGGVGTIHATQLHAREEAIKAIVQKEGLERSLVARLYDASVYESLPMVLDELAAGSGDAISAQVAERAKMIQNGIDKAMGRTPNLTEIATKVEDALQPTAEQFSRAQETLLRGEAQIVEAKVREIQKEVSVKQKEALAVKKELAQAERDLRLIKQSPLVAFKEQEGRDPKDGELGTWATTKAISLEGKVQELSKQSETQQGRVAETRGKFQEALRNLPDAQSIAAIEEEIAQKNAELEKIQANLSMDPEALKKAGVLAEQISALEERLARYGKPEARVAEAERALDTATNKLDKTDSDLQEAEQRLRDIRKDPLGQFIKEKNRQPKEGELETWKREEVAKAVEEIKSLKNELVGQLREVQNLRAEAEAYQVGLEKVTGSIRVGSGLLRQQSMSIIRQYQRGFAKGGALALKEANGVLRVAQQMVSSLPVSDKKKAQLLRKVRAVPVEQFNEKLPQFMDALNEVMAIERVKGLQEVAKDILSKMSDSKARNVGPKMQVFAEHLMNILNEKVPVSDAPKSDSVQDIATHALETLVADLKENDTDVAAAERAVTALKDFYTGELQRRLEYKEQLKQTNERIAKEITKGLTKGAKITPREAGLDAVRNRMKQTKLFNFTFATPYVESFLTIANDIDAGQGKPNMQGTMVKEFDPSKEYNAWINLNNMTREAIDNKLAEIYGPKFLETLTLNRTANFIDVKTDQGEHNITKSAAMSLYMMQKNPKIRKQMLELGYDEAWMDSFAEGNVFSAEDHAWMAQVSTILKDYASKVAPLYERLTGKPFRAVDDYFMVSRYMFAEEGAESDNTPSIIKDMMEGTFDAPDPFDSDRFKQRKISKREFVLPAIEDAITRYSQDMNHFLAYAEYATKLDALLKNQEFMSALEYTKQEGITTVLNRFLNDVVDGSQSRSSDRATMRAAYTALGWLSRNKIASPRSGFMQFTALAGFTDPTASNPVNSLELAQAALGLVEAHKSGELGNLLDTAYMKERWLGAFDQAAQLAEQTARYAAFNQPGKWDPRGIIRKLGTNKVLHEWMSISTRFGDRAPSVVGGWAVYTKVLEQTGDKVKAVAAAVKMIEEVNGSLDPAKSAEIYGRRDFQTTLFKVFTRSTSIYLDRYLRMHKAFYAGQITKAQYAKGLALYHVWIPMFTSMVAMGAGANFDKDEMKTMMLAGPLAYYLLIGSMFKMMAAGVLQASGLNEKFAAGYDSGGDILDGMARDMRSAFSKIQDAMEYQDAENMWAAVAAAGKVGDISPIPVGYLSRLPEATMKIMQGDWPEGLMEAVGYSSAATKVE